MTTKYRDSPFARYATWAKVVSVDPVWLMLLLLLMTAIVLKITSCEETPSKFRYDAQRQNPVTSPRADGQNVNWMIPVFSGNPGGSTSLGGTSSLGGSAN